MAIKIFTALLVQDVQNDYLTDGVRPVEGAEAVFAPISEMAKTFERVIVSQDYKPENHISFVDNHAGRTVGETVESEFGPVVLTQKCCVEGTQGADMPRQMPLPMSRIIAILKGAQAGVNSYSAFLEADRKTETGLDAYCKDRFVNRIYLCGLNVDDSLIRTAFDALHYEIEVYWVKDAVAGINADQDAFKLKSLKDHGVHFVTMQEVLAREIR